MSDKQHPWIVSDPDIVNGKPRVRDSRISVEHVLEVLIVGLLAQGRSIQEVLSAYPYLKEDDVREALEYAA